MDDEFIDYGRLIDKAMRTIVRDALIYISEQGLPGDHHFYITFYTDYPGVMIDEALKEEYEDEMTIVLQHQFWNLEIEDDRFSVVLSFNHVKQNLTIPFDAITAFADPSVKFGLQFRQVEDDLATQSIEDQSDGDASGNDENPPKPKNTNNVVELDTFRKK